MHDVRQRPKHISKMDALLNFYLDPHLLLESSQESVYSYYGCEEFELSSLAEDASRSLRMARDTLLLINLGAGAPLLLSVLSCSIMAETIKVRIYHLRSQIAGCFCRYSLVTNTLSLFAIFQ